jgi:hypothetical protein
LCKNCIFYYMFKSYKLSRDHLKLEIYLFQDRIQVSWEKTVSLLRYYTTEWLAHTKFFQKKFMEYFMICNGCVRFVCLNYLPFWNLAFKSRHLVLSWYVLLLYFVITRLFVIYLLYLSIDNLLQIFVKKFAEL